jgi:uncharacterized membrane protein YfcA
MVRSSLGFGGTVLTLPFLLLIHDDPLVFLPIVAVHLVIFSALTVYQAHRRSKKEDHEPSVDWPFLQKVILIMFIPNLIGVIGLIKLPTYILSSIILFIICIYALTYIFNKPFTSKNKLADIVFLVMGGYVTGTSLIGAPIVVAVFSKYLSRFQLRDTLLALWFTFVLIKIASFIYVGIDLQLIHHLWLLPCAAIGHVMGLKLHDYLLEKDSVQFYRILGFALLLTSGLGLYKTWS